MGTGGLEGVPREVIQWLNARNVRLSSRSIKQQMASGLLAAEVLEKAFPHAVQALMLDPGVSLPARRHNWEHLLHLCRRLKIELPEETVEDCIFQSHGACVALLNQLYTAVTSRRAESVKGGVASKPAVPAYAAPTAAQLLKSGLLYQSLDQMRTSAKAQQVVDECCQRRAAGHQERLRRVYEQWLPLGAADSLFLPTRERPSPPQQQQQQPAAAGLQQLTVLNPGLRMQQQQQQAAAKKPAPDAVSSNASSSAAAAAVRPQRAASGYSDDSD
ncbi:hypothetical protein Efla_003771 [Eimeria flavescens]